MEHKTVLIFGVSSFVGSNLAEFLKKDFRVVGTYYNSKVRIKGVLCLRASVLDRDRINVLISTFKPDFTIYAVGLSSVEIAHRYNKMADALNAAGLASVVDISGRYKARVFYISQDFVFSGIDQYFSELDNPAPNTTLGNTKVSGEFYVQKSSLNYLIIRSCPLYGRGINPRQYTWFEMMEKKMMESGEVELDSSIKSGLMDVVYLANIVKLCIRENIANRLLQISTTDTMTRYEFGKLYAKIFNHNQNMIKKAKWPFPEIKSERQVDGTQEIKCFYKMNTENFESIFNLELPSIEESLDYTFQRFGGIKGKTTKKKQTGGITYI